MIPAEDAEHYYSRRHRSALAMADATADRAARNIHLELARQYAKLANDGHDGSIAVLGSTAGLVPSS